LATLNGLSSYIITNNRSSYPDNYDDFIVNNFNYSFSVERQPLLRVKQSIPLRVALRQINAQFGVTANNIDGLLDIHGNDAVFNAVLKDAQNPSVYTMMNLTGIIVDQNYAISDSSYGVGSIKMIQNISKKRNIVSIPFGTNDPEIVQTAPPVLGIWTPTIVSPTVPKKPLPPAPPAPIITIPPTPTPPELDADLIWFKFFAKVDYFSEVCGKLGFKLENEFCASFNGTQKNTNPPIQPVLYILQFKNVYTSVLVEQKDTYYICSIGVNKNILNLDMSYNPSTQNPGDNSGLNFNRPFNEFKINDPCLQWDLRNEVYPNDLYKYAAITIKYRNSNFDENTETCQLQTRQNGETNEYDPNCPAIKKYTKWSELIPLMQTAYTNDLNRESYLNPYEIILTLLNS